MTEAKPVPEPRCGGRFVIDADGQAVKQKPEAAPPVKARKTTARATTSTETKSKA